MGVTKKPKKVQVRYKVIEVTESIYTCPSCSVTFRGWVSGNATRFICKCGQELIVTKNGGNE